MIAVLGGSFDPVHIGHLRVAIEVRDQLKVDQLNLIPCGQPPHRPKSFASAEQRLKMLELAIFDEQGLLVDDRELRLNRVSYTVDTLSDLRAEYAQQPICLIVGADGFQRLSSWHQWTRIFDLAHLVVVQRPGFTITSSKEVNEYTTNRIADNPQQLKQESAGSLYFLELPLLEISSTRIRLLSLAGKSIRYLVPDTVLSWIEEQKIYQSPE